MNDQPPSVEELFLRASELPSHQRTRYLDEQCTHNPGLRAELDSLLRAHDQTGTFLDTPVPVRLDLFNEPDLVHPETIGAYEVVRLLGSGGMGLVYLAEGGRPRRRVALKVLRTGIATSSVRRRFEMEAEALARLQHPGIAQVYEAGAARVGTVEMPFFAMELVDGVPLTDFARCNKLGTRERLALAAEVCDAVQHAHQRGVVHRDLKPGNVLVTPEGRPKVLDFGVARLADRSGTAFQTVTGQLIGTLAYMSPEQVVGDPDAIDARSDVYALGVILYELLAGRVPLDVRERAITEAARTIREDEPESLATLDRSLRGDIETIVRKAMEKDPDRRYQTASELAADLRRFLNEEPIVARPPSTLYQLRKFARRNKAIVAGTGAVIVVLIGGIIGTSIGLSRALEQKTRANAAADAAMLEANKAKLAKNFLQSVLTGADTPDQGSGAGLDLTVREVFRRAAVRAEAELVGAPEVAADVHRTIAETFALLGEGDDADAQFDLALTAARASNHPALVASVYNSMAVFECNRGDPAEGERLGKLASAKMGEALDPDPEGEASIFNTLGLAYDGEGRVAEAKAAWESALAIAEAHLPRENESRLTAMMNLADYLATQGDLPKAIEYMEEIEQTRRRTLGVTNPTYLATIRNLAAFESKRYHLAEARALLEKLLQTSEQLYGRESPELANLQSNYGTLLRRMGDLEGSEKAYREAMRVQRLSSTPSVDRFPMLLQNLASLREELGDFAEAEKLFGEALGILRQAGFDRTPPFATVLSNLAGLRIDQGRWNDAASLYGEALDIRLATLGPDSVPTAFALQGRGAALRRLGQIEPALADLQRALEIMRSAYGDENPNTANVKTFYSLCLANAGRAQDAADTAQSAIQVLQSQSSINDTMLANAEASLGACLTGLGAFDQAEEHIGRSLELRSKVTEQPSAAFQEVRLLLARLRLAQARPADARTLGADVLAWRADHLGECDATAEVRRFLDELPAP
ncbi:MAG: tetratricopeptide repeat protein [Phycisphaerales bacterium]|nr:tetratricopeptide repeat protein [Phycisphaerales bacterium]